MIMMAARGNAGSISLRFDCKRDSCVRSVCRGAFVLFGKFYRARIQSLGRALGRSVLIECARAGRLSNAMMGKRSRCSM